MNRQDEQVFREVLRLNSLIMGIVLGVFTGSAIFLATIWLVIKGGPSVGVHLSLLGQFFPGYVVTFGGSFIGFAYGFITGFAAGFCIGWVYNFVVEFNQR